jgi:ABC-type multidrug transport system fused ATPase/permease subunit
MAMVDATLSSVGASLAIRDLMNTAAQKDAPGLFRSAIFIAVVFLLRSVFGPGGFYLQSLVSERASLGLRKKMAVTVLHATASYLDTHQSGETVSSMVNDVEAAKQGFADLYNLIGNVYLVTVGLTAMLVWSWPVAVLILAIAGFCYVSGAAFSTPMKNASKTYQEFLARVTESATNILSGVPVVKSLDAEKTVASRFRVVTEKQRAAGQRRATITARQSATTTLVPWISMTLALVITGLRTLNGLLTIGDTMGLLHLISHCIFPFASLGGAVSAMQQSLAAVDRVQSALSIPQEESPGLRTADKGVSGPAGIEFDDVGFGYGEKQVLSGVTFSLEPGQRAALVGPSGAGKTTILKLMLAMYKADAGTIRLGGQDIAGMSLDVLRRRIAVVPQEAWLFPGTVRDNILIGKPGASQDEIESAVASANANEFIDMLPDGYETVLQERGSNLSGGQRQRLSLARAFLKNAPVLILDEATSSVDAESERLIDEAIDRLSEGRTVVTIAHSERMAESATVRIRLESGTASVEAGR